MGSFRLVRSHEIFVVAVIVLASVIIVSHLIAFILFYRPRKNSNLTAPDEDAHSRLSIKVSLALYTSIVLAACLAGIETDADPQASCKGSLSHKEDCPFANAGYGHV